MIDRLLRRALVPELKLPIPLRIVIDAAFLLATTVPFVYREVGLHQRFMFLPWIFFLSAYGVIAWYEQVNKINHVTEKRLVASDANTYPYPLYWVFVPLMLYYYQLITEEADNLSRLPCLGEWLGMWLGSATNVAAVEFMESVNFYVLKIKETDRLAAALLFAYASFGAGWAIQGRVYLNGYWGLRLYEPPVDNPKKLHFVRKGPYEHYRHPIYNGQIHLAVATAFTFGQFSFFVFVLVVLLLNLQRAWREERHLTEVYGESYEKYKKKTKFMWIFW